MRKLLLLLGFVILCGCVSSRLEVANPMTVSDVNYDKLWQTSLELLSEEYDIPYMNKEEGVIRAGFKEGGTLVNFWESDASSFKGVIRETFYLTRRLVALNLKKSDGGCSIEAQVMKQRNVSRNYPYRDIVEVEPYTFDPREADYYPFDSVIFPNREDAYIAQSAVWIPDGRDADYEKNLVRQILQRARKK